MEAADSTACPACGQNVEFLPHLMFDCPATSTQRDNMLDEIPCQCLSATSNLAQHTGCAKLLVALRNCAM
jgi:hypothetical protein